MSDAPTYVYLPPGSALPDVEYLAPFRAVVVVDATVSPDWQWKVSRWLVLSGCLYVVTSGADGSAWTESVDMALSDVFHHDDVPEDRFVMTTSHQDVTLPEALAFCKHLAIHPVVELRHAAVLHIADRSDEARLLKAYADA